MKRPTSAAPRVGKEQDLDKTTQEVASAEGELDTTKQQLASAQEDVKDLQTSQRRRTGVALVTGTVLYDEFADRRSGDVRPTRSRQAQRRR